MSAPIRTQTARTSLASELCQIAETGEIAKLHHLLARGVDVNASDAAGVTALMVAAYYGQFEMVRSLIDHGADVNFMDCDGFTAAMLARRSGHERIVGLLVARGAKEIPKPSVSDAPPLPPTNDEPLDTFNDSEATLTEDNSTVRALHAPPNIWEMVHETKAEFDPRTAFLAHLPRISTVALSVIALILVGGALFGFMRLKSLSASNQVSTPEQAKQSNPTSASVATTLQADSSSTQQSNAPSPEPVKTELPAPETPAVAAVESLAETAPKAKEAVPNRAQPDKRAATESRQQEPLFSTTSGTKSNVSTDNRTDKHKAQEPSAPVPKVDLALPQADDEKTSNRAKEDEKKDVKTPTPAMALPPKPNPTPKD
jgi:ankyrin repeat protein